MQVESCISCRRQAQSELPCQDVLGQLSAICVTVHISANKLLLLSVVLCLPCCWESCQQEREQLRAQRWLGGTSCNLCSARCIDWLCGWIRGGEHEHHVPEHDILIRERFNYWEQLG